MPTIAIFSIGRVQEFIEAARTTRDLWSGSYILSFLMSGAVHKIESGDPKGEVIIPYPEDNELIAWRRGDSMSGDVEQRLTPSVPSIIVAQFGNADAEKTVRRLAEVVESLQGEWRNIGKAVRQWLSDQCGDVLPNGWDNGWDEQMNEALEIHWVVRQVTGSTPDDGWRESFQRLEQDFGAKKSFRAFSQCAGDSREKCTLTGLWEQMGPEARPNDDFHHASMTFWGRVREGLAGRKIHEFGRQDRLSAVALAKRLAWRAFFNTDKCKNSKEQLLVPREDGGYHLGFPSTASVATAAWRYAVICKGPWSEDTFRTVVGNYCDAVEKLLEAIRAPKLKRIPIARIEDAVDSVHAEHRALAEQFAKLDGEWLYPESYRFETLEREYGPCSDPNGARDEAIQCREKLRALFNWIGEYEKQKKQLVVGGSPPRYYAILASDGDKMGKWLSGEDRDWRSRKMPDREGLGELSRCLGEFSRDRVREIVEMEYRGKLVYSGGDDVLALLPVEDALLCAESLRKEFERLMDANPEPENKTLTCSAGIAIGHERDPLRIALRQAREAERYAKEELERGAFAVSAQKRSGARLVSGSKWEKGPAVPALVNLTRMIRDDKVSARLPHRIYQSWRTVVGDSPYRGMELKPGDEVAVEPFSMDKALISEIGYLIRRHVLRTEDEKEKAEIAAGLSHDLLEVLWPVVVGEQAVPVHQVQRYLDLLLIGSFCARGGVE